MATPTTGREAEAMMAWVKSLIRADLPESSPPDVVEPSDDAKAVVAETLENAKSLRTERAKLNRELVHHESGSDVASALRRARERVAL